LGLRRAEEAALCLLTVPGDPELQANEPRDPVLAALALFVREIAPARPPLVIGSADEEAAFAAALGKIDFIPLNAVPLSRHPAGLDGAPDDTSVILARKTAPKWGEMRGDGNDAGARGAADIAPAEEGGLVILTAAALAEAGRLWTPLLRAAARTIGREGLFLAVAGPVGAAGPDDAIVPGQARVEAALRDVFPHVIRFGGRVLEGVLLDGKAPVAFYEIAEDHAASERKAWIAHGATPSLPDDFSLLLASHRPLPEHYGALLITAQGAASSGMGRDRSQREAALITLLAGRIAALEAETADLRQKLALAKGEADHARASLAPLIGLADEGRRLERVMRAFGAAMAAALRRAPLPSAERSRIRNVVATSPLFDRAWYLARYREVRESGVDPVDHYIDEGAFRGFDPGPGFSSYGYYLLNPDVLTSGTNPLFHYEIAGRAENRKTRPALRMDDAAERGRGNHVLLPEKEASGRAPRIVMISGEADTPGHTYRVLRFAEAARALGATVSVHDYEELDADALAPLVEASDLLFIWRAPLSPEIHAQIEAARQRGIIVVFDVDDLMVDPALADPKIIDGIRTRKLDRRDVARHFAVTQQTLTISDFACAPTHYLAGELQRWAIPTFVIPNGFDEDAWRIARLARRRRQLAGTDGLIRIGYPAGSRTHQRDFAVAVPALARILACYPHTRLVLFRQGPWPTLDLEEFPELAGLDAQIEWREMVPVPALPDELARFDINIAPLETGNPFCEAKSELKYFEAALVEVPSVCSPTDPFRRAIRNGETGFLAANEGEWFDALARLVEDEALRRRIGRTAYLHALWTYGPERRVELVASFLEQTLHRGRRAARAFALDVARAGHTWSPPPLPAATRTVFRHDTLRPSRASVVVPLYNYANYVIETLDSIAAQTLTDLDLVVVDDCSADDSLARAEEWFARHHQRFNRALLLTNEVNAGLARTRNAGFAFAETPFVMPFDADNVMLPDCLARCLEAIESSGAAFVYPTLECFGAEEGIFANLPYDPIRLAPGNYIDATALVRRAAWAAIGGYHEIRPQGWEDYDFWCRLAEAGLFGYHLDEVLARYRIHPRSMLRTETEINANRLTLVREIRRRHPWTLEGRERRPKEGWRANPASTATLTPSPSSSAE
jgi:glycosyltransferase involved in cell wall biosynthesis